MFFFTVVTTVLVVSLVGGGRTEEDQTEVAILKQVNRVNDDGSYTFGYEAADGSFKIETRDVRGNVKGMFGYVDSSGDLKKVSYSSSNNTGFVQTAETTGASSAEREALLSSFGAATVAPSRSPLADPSERRPILVLRDSALVAPTKGSFIQYIPKKSDLQFGAREFTTASPAYETSSVQNEVEGGHNEDLFVNPDLEDDKRFKSPPVPVVYPRKIVVTRRPVDDAPRGGSSLRRQLSRRLNEREEDGPHVYGNEHMNAYYDKHMDASTAIQENAHAERATEELRYELLEPRTRENRAGYITADDIDRTIVYRNPPTPPAYPAAAIPYRPRPPIPEPEDYRPNYPVTPAPPPPPPPPAATPYPTTIVQSLRDELMEFIMHYVHRRLNPYFQDYPAPYQAYYRPPPVPYPYSNYPQRYPPPPPPPYPPFLATPGVGPYGVIPQLSPNVQYSSQSSASADGAEATPQAVRALRARAGQVRRPYVPAALREAREQREQRRQQKFYASTAAGRDSSTIQVAASSTSTTTVAPPSSTPVRNLLILGTSPSTAVGDLRPVTEAPDEMEATS
ncbi:unnamed protein product [Bemisia tabaci]|uniref:Cuticular protein n=1 Tax=Bemisia tabaci TaxID=7038 RepID=A0A9P0C9J4_BEMTA|nr:unnamed protein product [Bemisia tabaci]